MSRRVSLNHLSCNHLCDRFYFQSNHGGHSTELSSLAFDAFNTFVVVFISCELSQRLADAFTEFNDLIDEYRWFRFPIKVKRILPMTLIIVQKPVSLQYFGSYLCCREAFKNVREINFFRTLDTYRMIDFHLNFYRF